MVAARATLLIIGLFFAVLGCEVTQVKAQTYQSNWEVESNRRWIGPEWWANPMTDWSYADGLVRAAASSNRTLCLMNAEIVNGSSFVAQVDISPRGETKEKSAVGFRIGRKGPIKDYRYSLVHAKQWIDAKLETKSGKLFLGDHSSTTKIDPKKAFRLVLSGKTMGEQQELRLVAEQGNLRSELASIVSQKKVLGGVSLLADGPKTKSGVKAKQFFGFADFQLSGDMVRIFDDRSFGPIAWTQYTVSDDTLRLQAQLVPLETKKSHAVILKIGERTLTSTVAELSRTATFQIADWDVKKEVAYSVATEWGGKSYSWHGKIRKAPANNEKLKLACFSCDHGYLFPLADMVKQVDRQDPDMLFFAGDQIYESHGGFGVVRSQSVELAMIDYLRKYYQFGWTWRDLLRDRPSIIIPDDHDVFQGNIWGHGGRKLPGKNQREWRNGGYVMPAKWVNAVEKTHVGTLPDPAVNMTLPMGIKPYFTTVNYGDVSFAVLEDRKFKTGPLTLPKRDQATGKGGELLGPEQEAFLEKWSTDWSNHSMKCALSQTIFCNACTHSNYDLKRAKWFSDSGAWPTHARNKVVRILGNCNALSIHGDQHLGILLRQGIEDFDDAGYAFMVPGTANGWPRAWWPGIDGPKPKAGEQFTGRFHDDAGNPLHVLGVGNPEPESNKLPPTSDPMVIGYRKGSGYGMVEFDRTKKTAKVSLYRLGNTDEQFPDFPVTLQVGGKPGN